MALPNNILQQVETYQESSLGYLQNLCCLVSLASKKFKDFNKMTANLGDTVTFDKPPRYTTNTGLVATFQASQQNVMSLTADQAGNTSYAFDEQQFIFNVHDYMDKFGKSAMQELATQVEGNVALSIIGQVPVMTVNSNGQSVPTGAYHTESGAFRFFGDGVTPISGFTQLAQMITNFKNFGSVASGIKVVLPDTIIPNIVGTGLNQFAPERNNDIAMSWEIGSFGTPPVEYYQSNLLPIHTAGTVGDEGLTLTIVSTNDPTGANITQITCSGAPTSDADAVKLGDLGQIIDDASYSKVRFLTWIGHKQSAQPVQFYITEDAASDGSGNVVLNIRTTGYGNQTTGLVSAPGANQNLNIALTAGMKIKLLPSHRAGVVIGGDAFYLAMPQLGATTPFPSSSKVDPDTGVSIRNYYGTLFGQNQQGYINDCVWGSVIVPEYSMRIITPI